VHHITIFVLTISATSSPETTTTASTTSDISTSDRNSIGFLLNLAGEADFMREFPKDNTVSQIEKPRSSITVQNEVEPIPAFEAPFRCAPSHKGHIHMPRESNLDIFLSKLDLGIFECQTQNYQTVAENAAIQPGLHPLSLDRAGLEQTALRIRQKLEAAAIAVRNYWTQSR
jgi:hypothetical protein